MHGAEEANSSLLEKSEKPPFNSYLTHCILFADKGNNTLADVALSFLEVILQVEAELCICRGCRHKFKGKLRLTISA